jgi:hypothetical protein
MAILVTAMAAYAFLTVGTTHADSVYKPKTLQKFCNDLGTFPPDTGLNGGGGSCSEAAGKAAGAHPDITTTLDEDAADLNFSNVVTMGSSTMPPAAVPVGTRVGGLHSETTLGAFNGACDFFIALDFIFFSVPLPNGSPNARAVSQGGDSTNIAFPQPKGTTNRFSIWNEDTQAAAGVGTPVTETGPASGYAAGTTIGFQNYPSHLLDIFDPNYNPLTGDPGAPHPLVPAAVYGSMSKVITDWIPLYFVAFPAGGLSAMPQPLASINANMGLPSVSVLNDPSSAAVGTSSITDFCTPLVTTSMLEGVAGATNRVTVPATAQTIMTVGYNASLRDTDGDGYENALDSCPHLANVGNPKNPSGPGNGDGDSDGIDDACDSVVNPGVTDQDGDTYYNRQDNCPTVANGPPATPQLESELGGGGAADKGPETDGMGDPCDSEKVSVVAATQNGHSVTVAMSDTEGDGRYMSVTNIVAKCVGGGTDADNDGYCATGAGVTGTTDGSDSGACGGTVPPSCTTKHNQWVGATHPTQQMDTDGDTQVVFGAAIWSDAVETYLGTDPTKSCAQDATANNEAPMDNWPYDLNDSGTVSGPDVGAFAPAYGKNTVNGPFGGREGVRYDFNVDGAITGADVGKFSPAYGKSCATALIPPWSQQ